MYRDTPDLKFSLEEYERRLGAVLGEMSALDVEVILVTNPEDIYYLSGFDSIGYYAYQFLVVSKLGDLHLFVHAVESAIADDTCITAHVTLWRHGEDVVARSVELLREMQPACRVGVQCESPYLSVKVYAALLQRMPEYEFVDVSAVVPEIRLRKSSAELAYVRQAARLADVGMTVAIAAVREGVGEREVHAKVSYALFAAGSEYAASPFAISSGEHSAYLHGTATERCFRRGELVTLELAGVAARYHVNLLRTAVIGEASPRVKRMHAILVQAVRAAEAAAGPGVPVAEVDKITRDITREYDEYRLHRTGYSLGIGYPPSWTSGLSVSAADEHTLEPGMVCSIEPTFALADARIGVVVGEDILITETGAEVLSQIPLTLESR